MRSVAARVAALIRVDAVWLATEPIDMRAGTETALARVVKVFGAAQPHHAYLFANRRAIRSMSRKACSPDNAACEGFFGRLKNELFYPRDWKNATTDQFIEAVDSYIRWYNEKRIKISLGSLSPIEYRVSLGLAA